MANTTMQKSKQQQQQAAPVQSTALAMRLPYPPIAYESFGIDKGSWKALVEAIFPTASCVESVLLALSYCRARKLDPFKRVIHIVPIYNKQLKRMVDTIWPGIGELRTTASRTGEYAGCDDTVLGPMRTEMVGNVEMTFPEWAQKTVYRIVKGIRCAFPGPRVYWLETYAVYSRDDDSPNSMWQGRPIGQLDKCCEAAALRAAFPEEIGGDFIPEEIEGRRVVDAKPVASTTALQRPQRKSAPAPINSEPAAEQVQHGEPDDAGQPSPPDDAPLTRDDLIGEMNSLLEECEPKAINRGKLGAIAFDVATSAELDSLSDDAIAGGMVILRSIATAYREKKTPKDESDRFAFIKDMVAKAKAE